ncbi:MAG: CD225/dispanin family protein [Leptospiraceae bacterium]|nr:CD225/dispanin family protein [Leptospiraceae bacterium]MCB1321349.1 CD225/dispanin family protein [Leptospiraceae bacterium]
MNCPSCSAENVSSANFCSNCGQRLQAAMPVQSSRDMRNPYEPGRMGRPAVARSESEAIQTFWIPNIIVTICFPLTGVIGMVFSANARMALARGDEEQAVRHANVARIFFFISIAGFVLFSYLQMQLMQQLPFPTP